MNVEELNAFLGGGTIGGVILAATTFLFTKKKYTGEVAKQDAEIEREKNSLVRELIDLANAEVERQKKHRETCEEKVEALTKELELVKKQIRLNNGN